jgi:hypothetical protein
LLSRAVRSLGLDGGPAAVKNALGYTLTRLGTDDVDVYRLGRLAVSVGAYGARAYENEI